LRHSGYVLSEASVYLDESCSHAGSSMLCVAGFLFESDHALKMDAEWRAVLARENMPYMRMSLFTKDGQPPYEHLSMMRRKEIVCGRLLGECLPRTAKDEPLSAYGWCLIDCLKFASFWAHRHNFRGQIAYFFETGHKDRSNADAAIAAMFEDDSELRRKVLRYGSHTFLPKEESGALQSADMLAWLAGKWFRKGRPGTADKMRADLRELLITRDRQRNSIHWWTEERLRGQLRLIADNVHRVKETYASLALQDARFS
jgi:hypothetical protein